MKAVVLLLAVSLAAVGVALTPASAVGCIVGNDEQKCIVSVQTIYCFTEPCDGVIVCVDHGLWCTNRGLP